MVFSSHLLASCEQSRSVNTIKMNYISYAKLHTLNWWYWFRNRNWSFLVFLSMFVHSYNSYEFEEMLAVRCNRNVSVSNLMFLRIRHFNYAVMYQHFISRHFVNEYSIWIFPGSLWIEMCLAVIRCCLRLQSGDFDGGATKPSIIWHVYLIESQPLYDFYVVYFRKATNMFEQLVTIIAEVVSPLNREFNYA